AIPKATRSTTDAIRRHRPQCVRGWRPGRRLYIIADNGDRLPCATSALPSVVTGCLLKVDWLAQLARDGFAVAGGGFEPCLAERLAQQFVEALAAGARLDGNVRDFTFLAQLNYHQHVSFETAPDVRRRFPFQQGWRAPLLGPGGDLPGLQGSPGDGP